jgi:serine/threonine protein kinase
MELLDGSDLEHLVRDEPFEQRRALTLMMQMCRGLEGAHTRGIIHRDLKPANVFIEGNGPNERAKILDFGLSKHVNVPSRTTSGQLKGTPLYMAPEQYEGKLLSARTDVWALGVVLYQMLTRELPFMADTLGSLALRVVQSQPPAPRSLRSELDPAVDAIVMRCLSKDPERRFATARELREALEDASIIEDQLAALARGSRSGDAGGALEGLVLLSRKYPTDARVHQRILEHHNRRGAHKLAVLAYEEAKRQGALSAELEYQASSAYQALGEHAAEAKTLKAALKAGLHPKLEPLARSRLRKLGGEA